jgi:peptide/nickel transport system permease protein|tara:strand:+ start:2683 stop:3699 length:1017 start_codon:yes stop_codon:yes gene_type:complete
LLAFQYFIKRIGVSIIVFFGVSVVIFCLARLIPGDPARIALGPFATKEMVEQLRETLHLNESIFIQYKIFIVNLFHGDLGISTYTKRPVLVDLINYFPATFELVLMSGTLMLLIGMPLGILSGTFKNTIIDHISRIISLLGVVTPSFLWAIILMLLFAYLFPIFPVSERMDETLDPPKLITGLLLIDSLIEGSFKVFWDSFVHLILPGLAIAMPAIGNVSRLTRTNLSDIYDKQYIEFARSYAFSNFKIATKYALKPASIPTVTIIGLDFAFMLGNAFLVETVFVWPGMAKYGVEVILAKDLNGIVATALVFTSFFLIINMLVDFVVLYLNPRIVLKD